MNHLYLIDSSVWIRVIRGSPPDDLAARVRALVGSSLAAVNPLIRLEIMIGAKDERCRAAYESAIGGLTQLSIADQTWDSATALGFQARQRGVTAHAADLIISASAIEHQAILVHADVDFDRIAASSPLRVESYA